MDSRLGPDFLRFNRKNKLVWIRADRIIVGTNLDRLNADHPVDGRRRMSLRRCRKHPESDQPAQVESQLHISSSWLKRKPASVKPAGFLEY